MLIPTADASQWVEATTPKVPRSSGRVVKFIPHSFETNKKLAAVASPTARIESRER
jgi:hypothetical protein